MECKGCGAFIREHAICHYCGADFRLAEDWYEDSEYEDEILSKSDKGCGEAMGEEINKVYSKFLLSRTKPNLAFEKFGQKVEFTRFDKIPTSSLLTEGVTPTTVRLRMDVRMHGKG